MNPEPTTATRVAVPNVSRSARQSLIVRKVWTPASSGPGSRPRVAPVAVIAPARRREAPSSGGCRVGLVQTLGQCVPSERRALDANGELHDALQGLEITELDVGVGRILARIGVTVEALLVNAHHRLEGADKRTHLVDRLAFDSRRHHRRRRLAD